MGGAMFALPGGGLAIGGTTLALPGPPRPLAPNPPRPFPLGVSFGEKPPRAPSGGRARPRPVGAAEESSLLAETDPRPGPLEVLPPYVLVSRLHLY